jgi:hypothetical protein
MTPDSRNMPDKPEHAAVGDLLVDRIQKQLVVDRIEVFPDVDFQHPFLAFLHGLHHMLDGGVGAPVRTEPVTVLMERRFEDRFEDVQ